MVDRTECMYIVCPQCRALVRIGEDLSAETRRAIADERRSDSGSEQDLIRDALGCDGRTAKVVALHIPRNKHTCHWCENAMRPGALLCPHCLAVNLDW